MGPQISAGDVVRGPYPTFAVAPIHERDLAGVAARALLTDDLVGRRLALTGPQFLTHEEMVAIIGDAIGRPLRYEEIPAEAARQGMIAQGFPERFVETAMAMYAKGAGQAASVTGEVERFSAAPGSPTPDPAALEAAIDGADAVLSGLGPRGNAEAGIASKGTQAIVDAMKATDARRLVVISSESMTTIPSPGRPNPPKHDPGEGSIVRYVVGPPARRFFLRRQYADLGLMEDIVRDSGLDWTIARPTLLTNKPLSGTYRTANGQNPYHGFKISRADLAHFMLGALEQPESIGKAITIAY